MYYPKIIARMKKVQKPVVEEDAYKSKLERTRRLKHQLCEYEGEILTIQALATRFTKLGIPHGWKEAKRYLINSK